MHRKQSFDQFKLLRRRLCEEALTDRPEFDETLHQRIVESVKRYAAEHTGPASIHNTAGTSRWWLVVSAAACLSATAFFGYLAATWQSQQPSNSVQQLAVTEIALRPAEEAAITGLDLADRVAQGDLDGLLAVAAVAPQVADLKDDTRLLAETLLQPLPVDVEWNEYW